MAKFALALAFLAAGAAGWLAAGRQCLVQELAEVRAAQEAADARLLTIDRGLAALRDAAPPGESLSAPKPPSAADGAVTPGADQAGSPGLVGMPRAPVSVEQRIEKLERQLAAAQGERQEPQAAEVSTHAPFVFNNRGFLGSLEQAEKELKLDASQKAGIERVIDDVERELETLAKQPNDEGKTLHELQEGFQPEVIHGEEGMSKIHEHMAALARFRQGKVPGTNETYGAAERRVRKDGKARARSFLNAEQAKSWDKSHTDMLFGGGGAIGATVMRLERADIALPGGR